jgi:hypothetical protein
MDGELRFVGDGFLQRHPDLFGPGLPALPAEKATRGPARFGAAPVA